VQDGQTASERLRQRHPDAVKSGGEYGGQHWVQIERGALVGVCNELKTDPENSYDMLLDVTAVHWPNDAEPMELVYHLYSVERNDRLRIKVRCADGVPVPSLAGVWHSAAWNEREAYDMFGIHFDGHPDLRRILRPDDYTDFPLRKEFPLYRG
jgi:NADH-quinone oxidoreductase subunit C